YRLEPNSVEAETPVDVVSQRYPLEACWISMTAPMPLSEVHILWWNPVIRRADAEAVGWETSSSIRAALHLAFCKDLHIGKPTWAVLIAYLTLFRVSKALRLRIAGRTRSLVSALSGYCVKLWNSSCGKDTDFSRAGHKELMANSLVREFSGGFFPVRKIPMAKPA